MKRVFFFSSMAICVLATNAIAANPVVSALHKIDKSLCTLQHAKKCRKAKQAKPKPPAASKLIAQPIPPEPKLDIPPEPKVEAPPPKKAIIALPSVPLGDCQSALKAKGVEFSVPASYGETADCHVDQPVQILATTLGKNKISFPDHPILNCKFAQQFVGYVEASVIKSIGPVSKLYTGPGFVCRKRNGSAKISEHAMGNAVDIERIELSNGQTLTIKDAGIASSKDYALLNTIRHAACAHFTTVLGPGANADHESHFHFDSGVHGKTGNYRICE